MATAVASPGGAHKRGHSSTAEHAYTVPKTELLEWTNRVLDLQCTRLEQFASGAVYCQLFDAYHVGKLNMAKVNFAAVFDYEFVTNYKQLQIGLNKLAVDKNIDVERLIKGHPAENLEFLQWLYYFCRRTGKSAGYNAQERRSASKGGDLLELPLPHSTLKPLNPVGGYNTPLNRLQNSGLLEPNGEVKDSDSRHKYIPMLPSPKTPNSPRSKCEVEPRVTMPAPRVSRRTASLESLPEGQSPRPGSGRSMAKVGGGQARPMSKAKAVATDGEGTAEVAVHADGVQTEEGFVLDPQTAQVADDAAQQAVTVLLRSLPGLKRLLGQVGSETHDGYQHRGKLRGRRDVMQTLVQHTWVLLRDLHLNSMNSGGMSGRTRARRLESLQKELQGAQALFEELCEEVDKAEKFFPIPEGAMASLAAAKSGAGGGSGGASGEKQTDTRQLDQALRAVGAAQTSLAPLHKASLIAAEAQCHHADSILAQAKEALQNDGAGGRPPFRITVKPDTMGYVGSINTGAYKDTEDWLSQLRNFPEDPDKPRFHVPYKGDDPENFVSALHASTWEVPTTPRSGGSGGLAKYGLGGYGEEGTTPPRSRQGAAANAQSFKVMSPEANQMVTDQAEDSGHHSTQYASTKPRRKGEAATATAAAIGMSVAVGAALGKASTGAQVGGSYGGVPGGEDGSRSPSFANPGKTYASAGVGADLDAPGQEEADAVAAALALAKVVDREEEERAEVEALTAAATKSAAMKAVGILADLDYSEPQVGEEGTDYASQLPAVPSQLEDAKPVVAATLAPAKRSSKGAQAGGSVSDAEIVEVSAEEGQLTSRVLKGRDLKEVTYEVRKLANGDGYKGPYLRGHKAGEGVYTFSNGDVYAGEFLDDQMEGFGVYMFANQGRYEGQWVRALYEGVGMETFARGSTYHGEYAKGMRCGFGICRYYNGDYYEGQWQAGLRHGRGMQQCTDESNYVGDYNSGKRHGLGVYSFPNGDRYMGHYQSDVPHGYGVYLFASGQKYEGQWYHGKKHGFCVYTIETGEQWAGEWRESKPKWVQSLSDQQAGANQASVARATKAAEQARGAAKDGASRADEHWRTNGPMQLGVRDVVLRADRAAAEAQGARQRALAVAGSIDESRMKAETERQLAQKLADVSDTANAVSPTPAPVKKTKGLRKLLGKGAK